MSAATGYVLLEDGSRLDGRPQPLRVLLGDDDGHIHRLGAANERPGRGDDPLEARDRLPEALLDVDDDERRTLRVELGAHPATFIVNSRRR